MVVRVWKARATLEGAASYRRHFETKVRRELQAVAGFRGAVLLTRQAGDAIEIAVETRWTSLDAIRRFAPHDADQAVVEPEAQAVLSEFDLHVMHYEVASEVFAP